MTQKAYELLGPVSVLKLELGYSFAVKNDSGYFLFDFDGSLLHRNSLLNILQTYFLQRLRCLFVE